MTSFESSITHRECSRRLALEVVVEELEEPDGQIPSIGESVQIRRAFGKAGPGNPQNRCTKV